MEVAFVTNAAKRCGVAEFGRSTTKTLEDFSRHRVTAFPLNRREDFESSLKAISAADIAIYNYHPMTLDFLSRSDITRSGKPAIGILHEFDYLNAVGALADLFRYRIAPDPSLCSRAPGLWTVPRIIPQMVVKTPKNDLPTIGTFGFATGGKNFEEIIAFAARHFEHSRVRMHIPGSDYCDANGELARKVFESCGKQFNRRVELEFSTDFLSLDELISSFLAGNDLNLFLYDDQPGRGISSAIDCAIAAERPFALSDCNMFRHIGYFAPELFLRNSTPQRILEIGGDSCRRLKALWTPEKVARAYDDIFEAVAADHARSQISRCNTVLTDAFRRSLHDHEEEMKRLCPAMFARKIPRANVQQAFVKSKVEEYAKPDSAILCVGYHEDTACYSLQEKGFSIDAIDPAHNVDLDAFFKSHNGKRYYDVIFSTSVIEHVEDDETFIAQIASLLAPGGVAILTMDFNDAYVPGDAIPQSDHRFYTAGYIFERLVPHMHECRLVDIPDWKEHEPDFEFEGARYAFATLVFQKLSVIDALTKACTEGVKNRLICDEATRQRDKATRQRDKATRQRDEAIRQRDEWISWRIATRPFRRRIKQFLRGALCRS
ncbi:hypothetical protein FACS1894205_4820 [Alphaproteobacteria bacterium]|nr:hypothetical protein FACS1894205_4820 [Alphaproteobacteria bacterium]